MPRPLPRPRAGRPGSPRAHRGRRSERGRRSRRSTPPAAAPCAPWICERSASANDAPRVLVTFVVQRDALARLAPFARSRRELMQALPEVLGVAVNFHEGDAPQILGGETVPLAGASRAPIASARPCTSPRSAPSSRPTAGRRGACTLSWPTRWRVRPTERDRTAKPQGARPLRGLRRDRPRRSRRRGPASCWSSRSRRRSHRPPRQHANSGSTSKPSAPTSRERSAARAASGQRFEAAVVNPPRRGTSPRAREALAQLDPAVVAYVSCDPDTLARDLDHLARLGYAPHRRCARST